MAYSYKKYEPGQSVLDAQTALDRQQNMRPADYQSQWTDRISQKTDEILNRKPFEYDVNADALWQQYKDNYVRNGQLAMQDTMGKAASMTGGYGNSYAQTAGQQVYQQYLAGLTDKIPELQAAALDRYNAEGNRLNQQYSLMADQEAQDYGRYQDQYNQWAQWTDYLTGRLDTERNMDYNLYSDEFNRDYKVFTDDRAWDYAVGQDQQKLAQQQVDYLLSMGLDVPEELAAAAGYNKAYMDAVKEAAIAARSAGSGTAAPANTYVTNSQNIISSGHSKLETSRYLANAEYEVRNDNTLSPTQKAQELAKINEAKKEYSLMDIIAHMNDYGT